jgi:glycosyltransferase involved in cell wall biosynthesis
MEMGRILVIDFCNYVDYQIGGFLSFARNFINAFDNQLALVGISTGKEDPIGKWFKKKINGIEYDYFALARYDKSKTKRFLPDRFVCFFLIRLYKRRILSLGIQNVLIQRQEILPAVKRFGFKNICYRFPGLENPLRISKYWFGNYLSLLFDKIFFSSFKNVKCIIAAGDKAAISQMCLRSNGKISESSVIKFPTRINTDIFQPLNKEEIRNVLKISESTTLVITIGRLTWLKGWKFMLDCYNLFQKEVPKSRFCLIGDGEDTFKIRDYCLTLGINDKVDLIGKRSSREISLYLNASDLYIMGSYKEGWSTSLLEAIACGIPACVTNFSSAKDIILEGVNGYVIENHDTKLFLEGMRNACNLKRPVFNDNVKAFSVEKMKGDLLKYWQLL